MKNIKNYIRYIGCMMMVVIAASCTVAEEEAIMSKNLVQVVGRVTEFKDHTVTSRALKSNAEAKINNMSLFIFEEDGTCVDAQYVSSSRPVFVIDRSKLTNYQMNKAKIYMLANVADMESEKDNIQNLSNLQAYTCGVESIHEVPSGGFPMIGSMNDVNLTQSNTNLAAVLEIPLTNLYAKMAFNISVNTLQSVVGYIPTFRLNSWEVYNVPQRVTLAESEESQVREYYEVAFTSTESTGSNPVSGANTLSFSFYLPEHKINPNTWNSYPEGIEEIEKQRFKPLRVQDGTRPTFVRINGAFTNHQGHMKNVSYDIYLGLDNWQNFQVLRNYQYNNNVVIRGITNSTDGKDESISIDHRVNVEQKDFIVAMERETMLDCHFEVRPMRVTLKNGGKVVAKVQSGCDWIRLETKTSASGTDATYCTNGKRKYFTTTLMTELNNTATVTTNENNCIWAYIDENVDIANAQDGVRTANITFSYYADANADVTTETPFLSETYTFAQRYLYPIKVKRPDGSSYTYYIEYFEEYLHDFDSDNDFNQTDYEGMEWGLDGLQLSDTNQAIMVKGGWAGGLSTAISWLINSYVIPNWNIYYDFYLPRDDNNNSGIKTNAYAGYNYCNKIISMDDSNIGLLSLDTKPNSAIEYCYNKNKRNNDGTVANMHWYLPAIDEVEEIVMGAYTTFEVFQDKYYWASQPSYTQHNFNLSLAWGIVQRNGIFMRDDLNRARATKVSYSNGKYQNIESGVPSNYKSGSLYIKDTDENSSQNYYTPNSGNYSDKEKFQEGNMARTQKNRIRAVYKP